MKKALTKENYINIYNNLEYFKKELEQIAEETIISLDVCLRYTREAIRDIKTM